MLYKINQATLFTGMLDPQCCYAYSLNTLAHTPIDVRRRVCTEESCNLISFLIARELQHNHRESDVDSYSFSRCKSKLKHSRVGEAFKEYYRLPAAVSVHVDDSSVPIELSVPIPYIWCQSLSWQEIPERQWY